MKHSWRVSAILLTIFLAAQVVGLFVVSSYVDVSASEKASREAGKPVAVYQNLPYGVERPNFAPDISYIFIGAAVIIGTILLLLIIKFRKLTLWKLWYLLAIVITLSVSFTSFLPKAAAVILSAVIAFFRVFKPNILFHNIAELFIYGGLAAIFVPVMDVKSAAILLVLISVYDFFAVFHLKHMVTLAKFQSENNMFAGLFVPKELSLKSAISSIKSKPAAKSAKPSPSQPQQPKGNDSGEYAVIGGGDIGFPLLFAGTALATFGFYKTLIIPVFAAAALLILLIIGKKGTFYPAMPFITVGCFVGYGILYAYS